MPKTIKPTMILKELGKCFITALIIIILLFILDYFY